MNLSDALELAWHGRWSRQRSGDRSRARALRAVRWLGEDRRASMVRESDLRAMVLAMREAGLSPASLNRHLSALAAVLAEAGREVTIPWQREPRGRTRWLTPAEVLQLRSALLPRDAGVAALVGFLAETGLRVGEALALTWADLDLGARPRVLVRDSKNGEPRRVPLTAEAVRCVRARGVAAGPWHGLSQSRVNHLFRWARDEVGSTRGDPEVVPHALRHTAASRLVNAGVSLPVVSAWLGHRDSRSTLRYAHASDEGLAEAARRLEQA